MSALPPADRRAVARPARARRVALPALTACLLGLGLAPIPVPAEDLPAGAALAVEMGCHNCHRPGSRHADAPTFEHLARELAKHRGDPQAAARLGVELRKGEPFHPRVVAHEQLSPETAAKLMQWLVDGAKRSQ
ncbi:hypothetical protein [Zeimonas arvi]|uniref:Cytochrome c domain-containing protein n=1 Tax=Zeimonas arvi TaxID=2498847 RepID=A0A5C8NSI7_9BURK|nr:hypothetical protein [Zeimonas arvi]TXL64148.1 hypothetical protein FHP08_14495 [Zeimonas arvi]